MVGDYVLQNDFVAKTKGENWYHLFVHSTLYCVPFILVGCSAPMVTFLFASHMYVDAMKARYKKYSYTEDQVLHYTVIFGWWLGETVGKMF